MASLLDPFGLWRTSFKVAGFAERQVMSMLRSRLETSGPMALAAGPSTGSSGSGSVDSLNGKMAGLLSRALNDSTTTSQTELFHKILDQLVPDEARILGALSDGSKSPMVNIRALSVPGRKGDLILENAALIGKTANVSLPAMTPTYVGHLIALGLVDVGPEDHTLKVEYEILQADPVIMRAAKQGGRGPLSGRAERYVLHLSAFGAQLWAATNGYPE